MFHGTGNRFLPWSDEEDESQEEMTGSGQPRRTGSGRPGSSGDESGHERKGKGQERMPGREEQVGEIFQGSLEG